MQEIQFLKQINILQQKGFNSNHHSLPKQLQSWTYIGSYTEDFSHQNWCATKTKTKTTNTNKKLKKKLQ